MYRFWNYLLYSTWRLLCYMAVNLIERPLFKVLSVFSFFRKNIEKGKTNHRNVMDSRNLSFNIAFAFGYMFFTTMFIYATIFLYLGYFLQLEVGGNLYYWFIAVVVLSYLTNQVLSWSNDKYLKYFAEFDNINNNTKVYLPAVLFHVSTLLFTALSVYWTVGFNF